MPAKQATTSMTEADLEARVPGAIQRAFPWMPDDAIKHQIKFTFKFGRQTLEANSGKTRAEARLDVLLKLGGKNLAVMEFKKPGLALTEDDGAQGLSYARLVEPPAPLVVVTNGKDVRFIETHTSKPWTPTTKSAKALKELVTNASRVAEGELRLAVDTLMRTAPGVWMQAVRKVSVQTIEDLTSSATQPALPFNRDFLIPRIATYWLAAALVEGKRLLTLEGTPLAGKSNVLRELVLRTENRDEMATMYIEAGVGRGALQAVADALGSYLGWPISPQEARDWLIRVSNHQDKRLVLAFDGLRASDETTLREIEDLSSAVFGPSLSLIVAIDEDVSQRLRMSANARSTSPLGRRSETVHVGQLSDSEFRLARHVLAHNRVFLMSGAELAPEYREPWVLRAITVPARDALRTRPDTQGLTLPSLLGLRLIAFARERFEDNPELLRMFRSLAKAMVADAQDQPRPPELVLQQMELGVIRLEAAERDVRPADLQWLKDHGFIRSIHSELIGSTILVRLPELLASEMARELASELNARAKDNPRETAEWLAGAASNLPLGELVAAQAIVDAAKRREGVALGVINALVDMPPTREVPKGARHYTTILPGGAVLDIVLDADGKGYAELDGKRREVDMSVDDQATYGRIHPWMILSHVAATPFEVDRGGQAVRADPPLLLQVGTCPVPLRAVRGPESLRMLPTKDFPGGISIVPPSAGVVEPITLGILEYLAKEVDDADALVASAASSKSIPLLARIHTALSVLAGFETHVRSGWAARKLATTVIPWLKRAVEASKPKSNKTSARKAPAKKSSANKPVAKKPAAKKNTGKTSIARKTPAKPAAKAPTRVSPKKAPKKTAAKKSTERKTPAKKASAKTTVGNKSAASKVAARAPAKKTPAKGQSSAQKAAATRTAGKKPVASKSVNKKPSKRS